MAVTKRELDSKQKLAKSILAVKGIDINEWLANQFDSVINENTDLLVEALNFKEDSHEQRNRNQAPTDA